MHTKIKEVKQIEKRHPRFGKGFWISVIFTFVALAGLATWAIVGAATEEGDTTNISTNSSEIYYGRNESIDWKTWGTYWYRVKVNGVNHDAMCMQASRTQVSGEGTAYINTTDVKRIMLVTVSSYSSEGSANYYNEFKTWFSNNYSNGSNTGWKAVAAQIDNLTSRASWLGSSTYTDYNFSNVSATNYIFALGHMMTSGAYANDWYGLTPGEVSLLENIKSNYIDYWFNQNYATAADQYQAYATWNNATDQTVGWLEYVAPPPPTRVRFYKTDTSGTPLAGATFQISGSSATYTTGSDGYTDWIEISDVTSIDYYETKAPGGYEGYYTVQACGSLTLNADNTCTAHSNRRIAVANLKIKKVDSETSGVTSSNGHLSVVGTVFCVYDAAHSCSNPNTTITIGSDGTGVSASTIPEGSYSVAEQSASTGYKTNGVVITVTVGTGDDGRIIDLTGTATTCANGNSFTYGSGGCWFKDEVIRGSVAITKVRSYKTLNADGSITTSTPAFAGIVFNVYNTANLSTVVGTITTDTNGNGSLSNLPYGDYRAVEQPGANNAAYTMLTFDFSIRTDGQTVNPGTQTNDVPDNPSLSTVARNSNSTAANPDKEIEISANASVTDRITACSGLSANYEYRLVGKLFTMSGTEITATSSTADFTSNSSGGCAAFDMVFTPTFDSSVYTNQYLGIKQYIYKKNGSEWILIGVHNDNLQDEDEKVKVKNIEIGTTANSTRSDNKIVAAGNVTIVDTIRITGLIQNHTYVLKGYLKDASGNTIPLQDINGNAITAQTDNYTMQSPTGQTVTVTMELRFDSSYYTGQPIYVYEYLYDTDGTTMLVKHTPEESNYDATAQSVTVITPTIGTLAVDNRDHESRKLNIGTSKIEDQVSYTGLVEGDQYYISGRVVRKSTGEVLMSTSNQQFRATGETGTVTMVFDSFDTTLYYNYALGDNQEEFLVQEWLTRGPATLDSLVNNTTDELLAKHTDDVEEQSIEPRVPSLHTSATYKTDGSRLLGVGDVTMKDYVDYEGLVEGEWYMIIGSIIDPATCTNRNDPTTCDILEIDDEFVRNTKTFKADTGGTGTVALEINLNTVSIQGNTYVVYERLYRSEDKHGDGRLLAVHEDLDDPDQTIQIKEAKIETTALDAADEDGVIDHEAGQIIKDKVHYDGLLMDEEYMLYGYLWNKTTHSKLLDAAGNEISATASFTTPTRRDYGDIEMTFTVDASELPGVEIVVFEYLFQGNSVPRLADGSVDFSQVVTKHADEENPDPVQTVKVAMRIGTEAVDSYDHDHIIGVGTATVIDSLAYEGATMGKTYKAKGWLVDKTTGQKVQGLLVTVRPGCDTVVDDDAESNTESDEETDDETAVDCTDPYIRTHFDIEAEKTFTIGQPGTEGTSGTVPLYFEFDSRELAGKDLVVYEELYLVEDGEEDLVGEHKNPEDEGQTVSVAVPEIHTLASDLADGDQELLNNADVIIVDRVEYSGLVPGTCYTLYGTLVDKSTGTRISGGVTEVTTLFCPDRDSGVEEIEFAINTSGSEGKHIVVFETLYIGDAMTDDDEIASHEDVNDADQTVWVKTTTPDTGLFTRLIDGAKESSLYMLAGGTLVAGFWVLFLKRQKAKVKGTISFEP